MRPGDCADLPLSASARNPSSLRGPRPASFLWPAPRWVAAGFRVQQTTSGPLLTSDTGECKRPQATFARHPRCDTATPSKEYSHDRAPTEVLGMGLGR